MKRFFSIRQNNSGGRWHDPAAFVIVEADTLDDVREHVTFCGDDCHERWCTTCLCPKRTSPQR